LPIEYPLVGMVARLHRDKNPLFMHRVFQRMRARWSQLFRPLHFVFIGDGPLREQLAEESIRTEMSPWVHFLGSDTPIPLAMRSLSLVMLASEIEGLPLVFFEAMSMGVPVVSTDLEGIPELVTDAVGRCVPNVANANDRLELLCQAALEILEDDHLREQMGHRARQRVEEHFNVVRTDPAYLAAFDDLFTMSRSPSLKLVSDAT